MAAGIMMIIQAAFAIVVGLWLFSVTTSDLGGRIDNLSGGTVTFLALIAALLGGGMLWTGIGAVRGRGWARIATIVLQSISVVLILAGILRNGGGIIPLVWAATILGLAIASRVKPAATA